MLHILSHRLQSVEHENRTTGFSHSGNEFEWLKPGTFVDLDHRLKPEAKESGFSHVRCSMKIAIEFCLLTIILCFAGCAKAPSRVIPEAPASNSSAAAISAHDVDKDGLLNEQELQKAPGLKAALKQADANGDGKLSAAEIDQRIAAWAKSRVGRMSVACTVTRRGAPLADAEVRFVPESFLGAALQAATGKTNAQGFVMPSAPQTEDKPPGLAPGYYRVEVTTAGNDVPAAYNTETTLGAEIAPDADALRAGPLRFDLP